LKSTGKSTADEIEIVKDKGTAGRKARGKELEESQNEKSEFKGEATR
jgi:hypothetical protein